MGHYNVSKALAYFMIGLLFGGAIVNTLVALTDGSITDKRAPMEVQQSVYDGERALWDEANMD